jgi:hypothetical protein
VEAPAENLRGRSRFDQNREGALLGCGKTAGQDKGAGENAYSTMKNQQLTGHV